MWVVIENGKVVALEEDKVKATKSLTRGTLRSVSSLRELKLLLDAEPKSQPLLQDLFDKDTLKRRLTSFSKQLDSFRQNFQQSVVELVVPPLDSYKLEFEIRLDADLVVLQEIHLYASSPNEVFIALDYWLAFDKWELPVEGYKDAFVHIKVRPKDEADRSKFEAICRQCLKDQVAPNIHHTKLIRVLNPSGEPEEQLCQEVLRVLRSKWVNIES